MKKYLFLLAIYLSLPLTKVVPQDDPVLMRINGKDILRSEFEYAYNQTTPNASSKKRINEFADQFVNDKLKIIEARKRGLDTALDALDGSKPKKRVSRRQRDNLKLNGIDLKELYTSPSPHAQEEYLLISQVLKYLPQNSTARVQKQTAEFMDSLYHVLQKNPSPDFTYFVNKYSDEKKQLWVSRKQMPKEFEDIVFTLPQNGISEPFQTALGWHMVKIIDRQQPDLSGEHIQQRKGAIHKPVFDKLKESYGYIPNEAGISELFSIGKTNKSLFVLKEKEYTGKDFDRFAANKRRNIQRQFDYFVAKAIFDHTIASQEIPRSPHKISYDSYLDTLLLKKITEIEVTQKSQEKAGLIAYFSSHKKDYSWDEPRYRGVVLHARYKKATKRAKKLTKKKPVDQWKDIIEKEFNTPSVRIVQVEQGLFKAGDNPYVDKLVFKKGNFTPLKDYPYASVLGKKTKNPETYEEAGTELQSDYRKFLESRWISELQRNSKVEINQEVLKTVNNH